MKLKIFLTLFITISLTNLLQKTYTCTAMKPNSLSVFRIVPRNKYEVIKDNKIYLDKEKVPKKNASENEYGKYMKRYIIAINPDDKEAPTTAKLGRYKKRCRCQICYWAGFPSKIECARYPHYHICGACYCSGTINGELLIHWSSEKYLV